VFKLRVLSKVEEVLSTKRLHSELLDAGLLGGEGGAGVWQGAGVEPSLPCDCRALWSRAARHGNNAHDLYVAHEHLHKPMVHASPVLALPRFRCTVLKAWIEPMPDGTLPNARIREFVLRLLHQLPVDCSLEDRKEQLKRSGLGRVVMFLFKLPGARLPGAGAGAALRRRLPALAELAGAWGGQESNRHSERQPWGPGSLLPCCPRPLPSHLCRRDALQPPPGQGAGGAVEPPNTGAKPRAGAGCGGGALVWERQGAGTGLGQR
jgi:hypothetical protein